MSKTATVWWRDGSNSQLLVDDDYRIPDVVGGCFFIEGIDDQLLAVGDRVQSISVCATAGNPALQAAWNTQGYSS